MSTNVIKKWKKNSGVLSQIYIRRDCIWAWNLRVFYTYLHKPTRVKKRVSDSLAETLGSDYMHDSRRDSLRNTRFFTRVPHWVPRPNDLGYPNTWVYSVNYCTYLIWLTICQLFMRISIIEELPCSNLQCKSCINFHNWRGQA